MRRLKAYHDEYNRDSAFLYIDGQIYTGESHGDCVTQYIERNKLDTKTTQPYDDIYEKCQTAFGHIKDHKVYLMDDLIYNISLQEVAQKVKTYGYEVYNDNKFTWDENEQPIYERVAGIAIDKMNRMFPGETATVYHGTAAGFVDSIRQTGLNEMTENSANSAGANYGAGVWVSLNQDAAKTYAIKSDKKFQQMNKGSEDPNITQYFGYGAIVTFEIPKEWLMDDTSASNYNLKSDRAIPSSYIKEVEYFNVDNGQTWKTASLMVLADAYDWVKERAEHLMDVADMDSDMAYGVAWQQWKKKNPKWKSKKDKEKKKKSARLLFANHDFEDRISAILYIDGHVFEAETHAKAINDYLDSINQEKTNHDWIRPTLKEIDDIKLPMAFAHLCQDGIYIETDLLAYVDLNTVINAIKAKYPNKEIYDDRDFDIDDDGKEVYKKIARLKQAGHDIDTRDYAIAYINGQIYTGYTHNAIINEYLKMLSKDELKNSFTRPFIDPQQIQKMKDNNMDEYAQMFEDDYTAMMEEINSLAFGHVVEKEKAVYLEENSMVDCSMAEAIAAVKRIYPGYSIYNDDSKPYEKVAWRNTLDNKQYDNEKYYSNIQEQINCINKSINTINSLNLYHNINDVSDEFDIIISCSQEIYNLTDKAKDVGIYNESELSKGRDIIDELEEELKSLENELEQINDNVYDLDTEINNIQQQIDAVQTEIDNMDLESTANIKRLVKKNARHGFICHAHDSIMAEADNISTLCSNYYKQLNDTRNEIEEKIQSNENTDEIIETEYSKLDDIKESFCYEVSHCISTIEDDMRQATDMNERMGDGIDRKITRIEELTEAVSSMHDEIRNNQGNKSDMENTLSELKNTLQELQNQLN